jgi:hypothetical protein
VDGVDAPSPAGQSRESPLATLAQAYANATSGDVIVLLGNHNETVARVLTITKSLIIVGEGLAAGLPTAALTMAHASGAATLAVDGVTLIIDNVLFEAQTSGTTPANNNHIQCTSDGNVRAQNCVFRQGQYSGVGVVCPAVDNRFRNCTFVSVATSLATRGSEGLNVTNDDLTLEGCTFDGGTFGFLQTGGANAAAVLPSINDVYCQGLSLLRGADFLASGASALINCQTATGGGRVIV